MTKGFQRLPGFRDFPPEDFAVRAHVFDAWRRVSRRYGFMEYDGPPLEPLELYVEKSGQEIVGQLYNFVDKGDREVSLRPEMTPSPTMSTFSWKCSRSRPRCCRSYRKSWGTLNQRMGFGSERLRSARMRASEGVISGRSETSRSPLSTKL